MHKTTRISFYKFLYVLTERVNYINVCLFEYLTTAQCFFDNGSFQNEIYLCMHQCLITKTVFLNI